MTFYRETLLKNGKTVMLRSGEPEDAEKALENFIQAHGETDYLLTYPEENDPAAVQQEQVFLQEKKESRNEIEILAILDGKIVGTAGIDSMGAKEKIRHRAEFGISVLKEFWGEGIGRALTEACVECAKEAGYRQLELNVVADNERATALYRSLGFQEFGRNPRGFLSREGWQELVYMRLELN